VGLTLTLYDASYYWCPYYTITLVITSPTGLAPVRYHGLALDPFTALPWRQYRV